MHAPKQMQQTVVGFLYVQAEETELQPTTLGRERHRLVWLQASDIQYTYTMCAVEQAGGGGAGCRERVGREREGGNVGEEEG